MGYATSVRRRAVANDPEESRDELERSDSDPESDEVVQAEMSSQGTLTFNREFSRTNGGI